MKAIFRAVLSATCVTCMACGASVISGANSTTYSGPLSGTFVRTTVSQGNSGGGIITCVNTFAEGGTATMTLASSEGAFTGSVRVTGTDTETGRSGDPTCPLTGNGAFDLSPQISGTASALSGSDQSVSTNAGYSVTTKMQFAGTLSGGVVSGTVTYTRSGSGLRGTTNVTESGSSTMTVTLH